MEITIYIDKNEIEKLIGMGLIDDKTSKDAIKDAIHELIYQRYELEKQGE